MNTRRIGKIFIGFGVVLLLAYVGWIVFRVVKQPEVVATNGLLPNPFDIVAPRNRPSTDDTVTPVGSDGVSDSLQTVDISTDPDKRLFRISQSPALAFTVIESTKQSESSNPLTGESSTEQVPVITVRYVTRDEGFVIDSAIESNQITEKRVSNAFVSGLYTADISQYVVVGQYRNPGSTTSTAYSMLLDKPPKVANIKSPTTVTQQKAPECSYQLLKVSLGDTGRNVEALQQVLAATGIDARFDPGVFDDVLHQAVVEYQTQKGITPNKGIIGPKTLAQLNMDCLEVLPKQPIPVSPAGVVETNQSPITLFPRGVYKVSLLDSTRLFILTNARGKNRGIVKDIATGVETEIYALGFVDWYATLLNNDKVLFSTVSSGQARGTAFAVSMNKTMTPLLDGVVGMATLPSPDGKFILYSSTEGGSPVLSLYHVDTAVTESINVSTFAEKCTWSTGSKSIYCFVPQLLRPEVIYPDEWYKRGVDITDELQKISIDGFVPQSVDSNNEIPAIALDAIEQQVTSDEGLIVFRDWKSGYIWGYRLK